MSQNSNGATSSVSGNTASATQWARWGTNVQSGACVPLLPSMTPTCAEGHRVGSTVRYVDGLIVGRCETCDERVTIRVPAGNRVAEAHEVARAALAMAKEGQAADALELIETYGVTLAEDADALTAALSVFETVRAGLARKLGQK